MKELPERVGKLQKIQCAVCNRHNEHTILAAYSTDWGNEDIHGGATRDFLRCNGCKTGTYRVTAWSTEDDQTVTLHPPRGEYSRQPKDFYHGPWESKLTRVYGQTIRAFNGGLLTLAGAGVRLLIEGICKEQGVNNGPIFEKDAGAQLINLRTGHPTLSKSLEGKINGMAERDIINRSQVKHLHEIRFLGNDAAHELDIPEVEVVNFAIDIVEHIFEQLYEVSHKARVISERIRP